VIDRVGTAVANELGRFGAAPGLAPIVEAWSSAVGSDIARNAWPARLGRDGTLVVHTSSSAWAFELGHLEPQIRVSLGDLAPGKVRFVVGPLPEPDIASNEALRPPLEPSDADHATAAAIAAAIDDESLRRIVAKAAALSLASAASDRSLW
jgi:hypothetical protein